MKKTKCPSCNKAFNYSSTSGRITCPNCWERFSLGAEIPEPEAPKEPTPMERLQKLRDEIDEILAEENNED